MYTDPEFWPNLDPDPNYKKKILKIDFFTIPYHEHNVTGKNFLTLESLNYEFSPQSGFGSLFEIRIRIHNTEANTKSNIFYVNFRY